MRSQKGVLPCSLGQKKQNRRDSTTLRERRKEKDREKNLPLEKLRERLKRVVVIVFLCFYGAMD